LRWERTIQAIAGEHGIYVALAQLVGFEGGKAFPGGSLVAGPRGDVLARAAVFEEDRLRVTVELDEITRVRADLPLLSDLEIRLPHLLDELAGRPRNTDDGNGAPVHPPVRRTPRPSVRPAAPQPSRLGGADPLAIDPVLTRKWLVEFLRDEVTRRRGFSRAVLGLSGGVDSAVVAYLAAEALGAGNVTALRMPYRTSHPESLDHAGLVIDALGLRAETVDITGAVAGLAARLADPPDHARLGNICARMRMITLFDRSAALEALPLGTGNKTERLFGYFTWHADDTPPVNPLGDLFKTQVWALARHLGVPEAIVGKPPTADLVEGQTDEADLGISYARADAILHWLLMGYPADAIVASGHTAVDVERVRTRLDSTHWKRKLPTVAMVSQTAIGEYYLRPVDF
jgi:NAD+ synthetase